MWLYSILLISSISVPLMLSFDKKLQFYKRWKIVLPSITIVAIFYIIFDVYLTELGVWGFNYRYIQNIFILNLPIEECLFFFVIPYASIFLHASFVLYFPKILLNNVFTKLISTLLIIVSILLIILYFDRIYTVYAFSLLIIALIISFFDKTRNLNKFYITFLIILIPFLLVNSVLTGSFIPQEVVWYNNTENIGIRIFTIPVEDFAYGFSLILFNLLLISKLDIFTKRNLKK